ncbi:MAG: hypothetical protein ACFFB8_16305, partial [Promethearchaeota archaeon]
EKDKDKKEKKEKDKNKEKEKEKKEKKEKEKDKEKKNKDKKEKEKISVDQEWKLPVSKNLDSIIHAYDNIINKFRDIDNYILKDAKTKEEFIEKVKKHIENLPEVSQQIFVSFLESLN